jgi:hypothetical protein
MFIYLLTVALSIVFGGAAHAHYLIQLLPFFCVYAATVYLYLLTDQLAYWLLTVTPPTTLAVHPADVIMNYSIRAADGPSATPEFEMRKILQTAPDYIVKPDVVWYLRDSRHARSWGPP